MAANNRLVKFFLGKNGSVENSADTNSSRRKTVLNKSYIDALNKFESCYLTSWAGYNVRDNHLVRIKFSLDEKDPNNYDAKYKDKVIVVLNSYLELSGIQKELNLMELSLEAPSNTTLRRFDDKKKGVEAKISNIYNMSKEVAHWLVSDDAFTKALRTTFGSSSAAEIFADYVSLAIAQHDFLDTMVKIRENTKPTSQVKES